MENHKKAHKNKLCGLKQAAILPISAEENKYHRKW
jgi:hypothetical protein